jgi:hypothetical protein
MKTWIKVKNEHPWLKNNKIGIVACFEQNHYPIWFSKDGKQWDGGNSEPDYWKQFDYEICTEEEAKQCLKK